MNELISQLKNNTESLRDVVRPEFFRLSNSTDQESFRQALSNTLFLTDELGEQLKDLIKSQHPTRVLSDEACQALIKDHLNGCPPEAYGVWVYYPWNRKMVHLLDEAEFIHVRTSRNQYKITNEERDLLATKKVGVIGLSVGQSVSVTIAMERGCGELRLADFDTLELTNYNRIRTGLHNLGLKKVVSVAREIAEIDPFLKVTCYPDGITEDNIDSFITTADGRLDVVIDECDGIDVKILCRQKAKALGIPVLMEASDRGTVDVERFDLEPDRPILHGMVAHLDVSKIKDLKTNEEKIPYLLPIVGLPTLSKRAKASMIEVGQTITTWPQLASAVTLGGGIVADVCRRIFLDEYHDSGRYFIDMDELIADRPLPERATDKSPKTLTPTDMANFISGNALALTPGIALSKEQTDALVGSAILAPSGGNAQPWKWHYADRLLYLFRDTAQETYLVDFNHTASYIGLGAATENLVLKAHEMGLEVSVQRFPQGEDSVLVAVFSFAEQAGAPHTAEAHIADDLAAAIPMRGANRNLKISGVLPDGLLAGLSDIAATVPGARLSWITEPEPLKVLSDLIGKADRMRIMHEGGHADFRKELVWTEEEARTTGRGIEVDSLDLTVLEKAGLSIATDWAAINHLNNWNKGEALERASRKSAQAAQAIGLITVDGYSMDHFFQGGRAVERVWLSANQQHAGFQPLSIATFLFNRLIRGEGQHFTKKMADELSILRSRFEALFPSATERAEILLFRLFATDTRPKPSFRAPLETILSFS